MDIQLNSFFDKNLGDDYMQRIVVRAFPEHHFYIKPPQREMMAHLENEPNVSYGNTDKVMVNVIGTGFLFNSTISKVSTVLAKKKPTYKHSAVVDCSIELVNSKLSAAFTKHALMPYDHISCRDEYSLDFIKKQTKKADVSAFPDIVFTQNPQKRNGSCLGIAPIRNVYGDCNYDYYIKLAKAADAFVDLTGEKVLLFAFNNGVENDVSACGSVRTLMKHNDRAEIIAYHSNIDEFVSRFADCGKMICSRFHSAVLALLSQIPIIAMSDTSKVADLANVLGFTCIRRDGDGDVLVDFVRNNQIDYIDVTKLHEDAQNHITSLNTWLQGITL